MTRTRPTWSHAARCGAWSTRHRWHQRRSKRNGCCDLELTDLQLTCPWTQSRVPISSHLMAALNRLLMVTTMCEVSIGFHHAYPVSSATISTWHGRTSPGQSSSSSAAFPTRRPAVPTSSRLDGRTGSAVRRADPSRRRRCRGGCCGSARHAAIRSRSLRARCSTRPGPPSIFGSGPHI